MLPNFIIIGAQRCATGWISQCLREHPDIFVAKDETRFFDCHYDKGLEWWEQEYFADCGDCQAVGEKSANYFFNPESPERLAASLPEARLICCLRNPIDRFCSEYFMRLRQGREQETTLATYAHADSELVQRGLYRRQLERFLEYYPRERLHVSIYEDKTIDAVEFIAAQYRFLGVNADFVPPSATIQVKAGAFENRHPWLYKLSRLTLARRSPLRGLYTRLRPAEQEPDLDAPTRDKLLELFRPENEKLEELLGRKLDCWT